MDKQRFKVCACLLIKDENAYLNEWLDWHRGIGVEHFFIYDNGSKVAITDGIAQAHRALCSVVDFLEAPHNTQEAAYNDCLARFGAQTEWMAFIDTDEFIRVLDGTQLPTFLEEFSNADGLVMRWNVYNADGHMEKLSGLVRDRFHKVVAYPDYYPQCKCIVRPERIRCMGAHYPIFTVADFAAVDEHHRAMWGSVDTEVTRDRIVVDHYFTRSYEEWQDKMRRGSCDPRCVRETDWFLRMNPEMRDAVELYERKKAAR